MITVFHFRLNVDELVVDKDRPGISKGQRLVLHVLHILRMAYVGSEFTRDSGEEMGRRWGLFRLGRQY